MSNYTSGGNEGALAARAREIGLESREGQSSSSPRGGDDLRSLNATRTHLRALAPLNPEVDEAVQKKYTRCARTASGPAWMSVFSDPDSVPADDSLNANDALAAAHTEQDGPAEQGNADGDEHGHGIKSGSNLGRRRSQSSSRPSAREFSMPKGFQEGGIFFSLPMIILSYCLFCWGSWASYTPGS